MSFRSASHTVSVATSQLWHDSPKAPSATQMEGLGWLCSTKIFFPRLTDRTLHVPCSREQDEKHASYLSGRPLRPGTATVLRAHPQTRLVSQCAGPSLNLSYRLCLKKKSFGEGWVGDTLGIPQEDVGLQSIEEHMPLIRSCLQGRRPSMPDSAAENAWGWWQSGAVCACVAP